VRHPLDSGRANWQTSHLPKIGFHRSFEGGQPGRDRIDVPFDPLVSLASGIVLLGHCFMDICHAVLRLGASPLAEQLDDAVFVALE
jgi:hypothetical protein